MSRLLNLFYKTAVANQSIFCAETNGVPRTEWQDGWNACVMQASADTQTLLKWYNDLPLMLQACVLFLLDTDVLELDVTDGAVDMWVVVNDFFGPGADGEGIAVGQLSHLANTCASYPVWGRHALVANARNALPYKSEYLTDEVQAAINGCKRLEGRSWLDPKIMDVYRIYT